MPRTMGGKLGFEAVVVVLQELGIMIDDGRGCHSLRQGQAPTAYNLNAITESIVIFWLMLVTLNSVVLHFRNMEHGRT